MDGNLIKSYEEQQQEQAAVQAAVQEENAGIFRMLAPASLIYALIYTLCIYKNTNGITMPLWIISTLGYSCYVIKLDGKNIQKDSIFAGVVMLLLGISTFTTGNHWIILLNYAVFFLLLVGFLLRNLTDTKDWDFGTFTGRIMKASVCAACGIGKPFLHGNDFLKTRKKTADRKGRYILFGILLAVPCVLLLGALLMTADMVFAEMIADLFSNFRFPSRIFGIGFMICFGFFSSYCGICCICQYRQPEQRGKKTGEPLIAITVTFFIAVLYIVFCGVQMLYLFAGNMQLPEGITYAEYARTGFFQLLFVCVLNLMLVTAIKKYFKTAKLLDILLIVISVCTFVMTASSACRMILYIRAYSLTFLRVAVLVALFAIAFLMTGVIISILRPAFPLFRYGIAGVSVIYLLFAFSHVDYFIASYNLAIIEANSVPADYEYITCLSTDAAPAIAAYMEDAQIRVQETETYLYRDRTCAWINGYLKQTHYERTNITPRNFNVSHYIAAKLFE